MGQYKAKEQFAVTIMLHWIPLGMHYCHNILEHVRNAQPNSAVHCKNLDKTTPIRMIFHSDRIFDI